MKDAAIALLFGALLAGCASSAAVPAERITASKASIRAAEEVGAAGLPRAEFHLRLAQQQVDKAQQMIEEGDTEEAELLLLGAQADAELALALTKEHAAEMQAVQALQQVQTIQQRLR